MAIDMSGGGAANQLIVVFVGQTGLAPVTISQWFRYTTGAAFPLGLAVYGSGNDHMGPYVDTSTNTIRVEVVDGVSGGGDFGASAVISVNTWNHIVVTLNGTAGTVYLNAAQSFTFTVTAFSAAWGGFLIGDWSGGDSSCILSDVCVWNAVLSPTEIALAYRIRRPSRRTSLVAYYPFFSGGSYLHDYSGNARNLSINRGSVVDSIESPPALLGPAPACPAVIRR